MNTEKLSQLRIASEQKRRPRGALWGIFLGVAAVVAGAAFFAMKRDDGPRVVGGTNKPAAKATAKSSPGSDTKATRPDTSPTGSGAGTADTANAGPGRVPGSLLTVNGYIIARERIEISPRFMGVVNWIGVKKGDAVTNGQVVALLDDAEYKARITEGEGRLAVARVAVDKARLDFKRAQELVRQNVEMEKTLDDARLALSSAEAQIKEIEGSMQIIRTWLEWTVIRSPVNGVVLEKLVDANELVSPQTFGGTRGPSASLLALADLTDLQVEIDLNEADLAKVRLNQKCRVSPLAYREKSYDGYVAEIAPEASRLKGTLQVKVQIMKPDKFLTPELSAEVDFLSDEAK